MILGGGTMKKRKKKYCCEWSERGAKEGRFSVKSGDLCYEGEFITQCPACGGFVLMNDEAQLEIFMRTVVGEIQNV